MKENVLLLCLSDITRISKNTYTYKGHDENKPDITGIQTNEAPAKYVIRSLAKVHQKLDRVVMICSGKVSNPIGHINGIEECPPLSDGRAVYEATHREYYEDAVNQFAIKENSDYKSKGIDYNPPVPIPDTTQQDDVSKAVLEASSRILSSGNDINLYIDFNGGPRYIAFMILAISSLMKVRNVNILQVLTMNTNERDQHGRIIIKDIKNLFQTIDLSAGIKEYINYGRAKGLRDYFSDAKNEEITKLIDEMENLSNNLQLCNTDEIMDNREALLQKLESFVSKKPEESSDTETQLFYYVVKDILNGYRGLLDGDLPHIIKWCVEHDYIQQAITFCTERMPLYFIKNGIVSPSDQEKVEFEKFLYCRSLMQNRTDISKEIRNAYYNPLVTDNDSHWGYYWLINYLQKSFEKPDDPKGYASVIAFGKKEPNQLMLKGPRKADLYFKRIAIPFFDRKAEMVIQPLDAQRTGWFLSQKNNPRAVSKYSNNMSFINMYFLLKDQRNLINHSADNSTKRWSYDQICTALSLFADNLIALKEKS